MRSAFHSSRRPRRIRPATRHRRPGQGLERLEPRRLLTADAIALEPVEAQIFANEVLGPPEAATAVAVLDHDPATGGSFLAVWQSDGEDGDGFGVFAQAFDREGTAIPGLEPIQVNQPLDLVPTEPAVGNQFAATVASDGAGRFVIAWQSEDQENGGYDIFVRTGSFDPIAGLVFTDQVRANSAVIAGDQTAPAVAMDDTGRYVVAWAGANPDPLLGIDIYFKPGTFAGGLSPGDEALANITTSGDQTAPAVAVDRTTGDLLIAWRGPDPTAGPSEEEPAAAILMNLFRNTPDQLTTGELKVNAGDYSDLANPAAAFSANGQLTVAWQTEGGMGTGSDIAARRFLLDRGPFTVTPIATDTAAADADLILNQTTAEPQRQPAIGSDASGNLFAVWQTQGQDGFSWAIFGRRLDAAAGPNGTLGAEFLVNTGIQFGPQIAPAISVSPAGRSVVGWIGPDVPETAEEGEGGHPPAVHAKIFADTGGSPVSEELLLTTYSGLEDAPLAAAADAAGNYVVVWQSWEDAGDGSDFGVYAKRFQADGRWIDANENGLDDDAVLVNTQTAGRQASPAVAMDQAGNFVVIWQTVNPDVSGTNLVARRYDASAKTWIDDVEFVITDTDLVGPAEPAAAVDEQGRVTVVWTASDEDAATPELEGTGIFARRFALAGEPNPAEIFRVNDEVATDQNGPTIAASASGELVVAWVSDHNGLVDPLDPEKSIFARGFAADGSPLGDTEFLVHEYVKDAQEHPAVGIDDTGRLVIAWQSINQELNQEGEGTSWGVYARQFTVDRVTDSIIPVQPAEFRVNQQTSEPQRFPAVGIDAAGRFLVAWQSLNQDGSSWAVVQRYYAADGTPAADEAVVNTSTRGPQILPVIAQAPAGDATILWTGGGTVSISGDGERQDSLFASDDFARADGSGLGSGWAEAYGGFEIASETAVTPADKALATLVDEAPADVSVTGAIAVADTIGAFAGLTARVRDGIDSPLGDTMYWGGLRRKADGYVALIRRSIDGFWETLSQQPVATGSGLVRFDVIGDALELFLDDVPVGAAQDSAITAAGRVGIRSTSQTAIDDIAAAAVSFAGARNVRLEGAWSRPYRFIRDDFNRPDNASLGAEWTERYGQFRLTDAAAVAATNKAFVTFAEAASADVSLTGELSVENAVGAFAGFAARAGNGIATPQQDTMYWGGLRRKNGGYVALIRRSTDGFWETLSEQPMAAGSGLVRFDVVGDSLKLFVDGELVGFVRDRMIPAAGAVGVRSTSGTAIDDFTATNVVLPMASFPFQDRFSAADGGQLDRFWDARSGNFTVQGNRLVGANPVNTTTLRAALAGDASISMTVQVPTAGTHAGALARGVPQRNTAYWGGLVNRSGSLQAEIWRIVDGQLTVLASSQVAAAATEDHLVQLNVAGNAVDLSINGSPIATAVDATLSAAGLFGMRATAGASIDDFAIALV